MSGNTQQPSKVTTTMKEEDDIYIDCRPVDIKHEEITSSSYSEDGIDSVELGTEIIDDMSKPEFNIFDNIGVQALISVGLFTFILVTGNYVFNKIPSSRLEKAIIKERYS